MDNRKKVIFLCTRNSARSQMAEAFLRHYAGDQYEAYSAGFAASDIHPMTIAVMQEIGIDISDHVAKSIKDMLGRIQWEHAIIVCRRHEEDCPKITIDARFTHRWLFDDPLGFEESAHEQRAKFREVRDQIEDRLKLWLAETAEAEGVY